MGGGRQSDSGTPFMRWTALMAAARPLFSLLTKSLSKRADPSATGGCDSCVLGTRPLHPDFGGFPELAALELKTM
jgi:hypothetical protein